MKPILKLKIIFVPKEPHPSLDYAVNMAEENHITLCFSNPAFEIWLLSHFEKKAKPYKDADEVILKLNRFWKRHNNGNEYKKSDEMLYDRMKDRTEEAIENSKWVLECHHRDKSGVADANSSTDVYKLVSKLLKGDES